MSKISSEFRMFKVLLAVGILITWGCTITNAGQNGHVKTAAQIQKEWEEFEKNTKQEWVRLTARIEKKWDILVMSSQKEWVDYGLDNTTRSRVDFKEGMVTIETLVREDERIEGKHVATRIYDQLKKIVGKQVEKGQGVLDGQIGTEEQKTLSKQNLDKVFTDRIAPEIKQAPGPVIAKDGVPRKKYTVSIKMVPDHIDVRARKYVHKVSEVSNRFSLNPALIMAVIHTESYFNPMAVSGKGAVGLMQIVPKWAGKEAYEYLYGPQGAVPADYLYSPGINLELGSAYLHLLHTRYYGFLKDGEKIKRMSICAYNWGPTAMNRNIVKPYNVSAMARDELTKLLLAKTPGETKDYLEKVLVREKKYQIYFQRS